MTAPDAHTLADRLEEEGSTLPSWDRRTREDHFDRLRVLAVEAATVIRELAGGRAEVWDAAVEAARQVVARRAGSVHETDIDLLTLPNPYRPASRADLANPAPKEPK